MRTVLVLTLPCLLLGCPGADDVDTGAALDPAPSVEVDPGDGLTDLARQAVEVAPTWVQDDLAISLAAADASLQDELAALLVDLDEPWLTDEVAFAMAHTSPEALDYRRFHPQLLVDNARWIDELAPLLDYVELVDVGDPLADEDFHTTARYRVGLEDGSTVTAEVDRELYYWYVVHPRLEDELPLYVDGWSSSSGVAPGEGWLWREFLWEAAADDCPSGRECPLLADYLVGVDTVWNSRAHDKVDNGAIGALIQYVQDAIDFGAGDERPIQPNRIYTVAAGNCGEHADLSSAAARTGLIPTWNVGAKANDHTWNEFWDVASERWVSWEPINTSVDKLTYYADENGDYYRTLDLLDNDCDGVADEGLDDEDHDGDGTSIAEGDCNDDDPGVYPGAEEIEDGRDQDCDGLADEDFGAPEVDADEDGWTVADGDCDDTRAGVNPDADDPAISNNRLFAMTAFRGDTWSTTERTVDYGTPAWLEFSIEDERGRPVDGAVVNVFGNWGVYGYPDAPAWAAEVVTDLDGLAVATVGEANEYTYGVRSPIGYAPGEGQLLRGVSWTEPHETYDLATFVNGRMPAGLDVEAVEPAAAGSDGLLLEVDWQVESYRVRGDGGHYMMGDDDYVPGSFSLALEGGRVDLVVVDGDQLARLRDGEAFEAVLVEEDSGSGSASLELPADRDWHVVVANPDTLASTMVGDVSVRVTPLGQAWSEEDASGSLRFRVAPQGDAVLSVIREP